ncbi:hypothetical protein [Neptuniibacter marinus]
MDVHINGDHNRVVMGDCYQLTLTADAIHALGELIKLWMLENKE